jgi:hypothetical protein
MLPHSDCLDNILFCLLWGGLHVVPNGKLYPVGRSRPFCMLINAFRGISFAARRPGIFVSQFKFGSTEWGARSPCVEKCPGARPSRPGEPHTHIDWVRRAPNLMGLPWAAFRENEQRFWSMRPTVLKICLRGFSGRQEAITRPKKFSHGLMRTPEPVCLLGQAALLSRGAHFAHETLVHPLRERLDG